MDIKDWIKAARTHKGWTQQQLGDAVGRTKANVGHWEAGKHEPKLEQIEAIAAATGYATPLLGGLVQSNVEPSQDINGFYPPLIDLENNPDYPAIRRVRFALSAGAHGYAVEYEQEPTAPIVFKRQWYERNGYRPEKLFAVRVMNGSMEPGLYDGDVVVVNTEATTPKEGCVFAVNYEGEMVIKRLVRDAGSWWLCSDNPDQRRYPRKVCDEHCILIGQIVHKQSERI